MLRNTGENMSILGNVFDCQHARRDPDELYIYSRNLATPSGLADDIKDSEKRRNWEKWERRTISINTSTLLFSKSEKKSRRQISLLSMTNHALGIWTCTQVTWQFRVISLGDASVIPWPNGISELDREFPRRSLRKGTQQKERATNSDTERKTEECFQRKTIGSCSRRDACSFLHTHATGDREDNVEWSGETQEILTQSKHTLQYRKWRHTDGKASTV